MSKTPLRSLRTIAVAAGLVFAQAAVLTQQSSPASANVGTNIQIFSGATGSNGVYTAAAGTLKTIIVTGSGFQANSPVEVTFNAPAGFNNTVGQHAVPPGSSTPVFSPPGAINILGDTSESAPAPTASASGTFASDTVALPAGTTGGTFTLTFNGDTTGPIAFNASDAAIQTALNALPDVTTAGGVTVTGGPLPGTPITVTYNVAGTEPTGAQPAASGNGAGLTGAASSGTVVTNGTPEVDTLSETATGGDYTLTFGPNTTPTAIPFDASDATISTALNALPSIITAGGVTVGAGPLPGTPATITFTRNGAQTFTLSVNPAGLTGGTATITTVVGAGTTPPSDTVTLGAGTSGGTFTLTANGQTTVPIAFNASNAQIGIDLNSLPNVATAGGVTVANGPLPGTPVVVAYVSNAAEPPIIGDFSLLTGAAAGGVTVTPTAGAGGVVGDVLTPNTFSVVARSDSLGNLVGTVSQTGPGCAANTPVPCTGAPAQFTLPANAPNGLYTVKAVDNAGTANVGTLTLTLTPSTTQQMTVTPLAPDLNNGVGLGGSLSVFIAQGGELPNAVVQFSLADFVQSTPGPGGPNYLGGPAAIPLKVLSCTGSTSLAPGPTFAAGTTPTGFTAGATSGCVADAQGRVSATVQLVNDTGANTVQTLSSATQLLYPDGVYSLIANSTQTQAAGATAAVATYTNTASTPLVTGVQLDHTATRISLSTSQSSPGGSVNVRGFGFAANSGIDIIFGAQQAPNTSGPPFPQFPPAPGCAFALDGPTFTASYTAGTSTAGISTANCDVTPASGITTDSSGSFNATVTLPSGTIASTAPGVILVEDFNPGTGNQFNASAIAPLGMGSTNAAATLQISPNPAAVGSTVTITGTGYTPFESVKVTISDSATGCVTNTVATLQAGAALTAGGTANVVGSFIVPDNACTVVLTSAGLTNAGVSTTVSATGAQSGLVTSNTLVIPPTAATISLTPINAPTTAVLTGSGFAAGEPVSFSFGAADPFTGGAATQTVVVGTADGNGNVTVSTPVPAGTTIGLFSVSATGLNSGFKVTGLQNVITSGFLSCPTGSVLPGQQLVLTGTSFSSTGLTSLFAPANGTGTISINFAPTAVPASQVAITSAGTFVFTTTVPLGTTPGAYTVQFAANVASGSSTVRTCTITVVAGITPTIVVTSGTTANLGATIPVSLTGFAAGEPITVEFDYISTSPLSGQTVPGTVVTIGNADANGNLQGTYTIPASLPTLPPGQYSLVARGTQTTRSASVLFILNPSNASTSGVSAIYFPEGFTGTTAGGSSANFTETLNILNANNYTTTYTVTYFVLGAAAPTVEAGTIGADSVVTRTVNTDVGANQQVASEVSSPAPLAASRNIWRTDASGNALDASSSLGVQLDTVSAVPTGGDNYYFATSDVQLTNEEYLSLLNPTATAETVTINVLPQSPLSSTTVPTIAPITVNVPANGRVTEAIRKAVVSSGITAFGLAINSTGPTAIERVEYYGDGIGSAKFGADTKPAVAGMGFRQYIFAADYGTAPSTGGTAGVGTGNDLSEVDIINPGAAAAGSATVTVSFFGPDGSPINSQQVQVDGGTRDTVEVNDVVGTQANVFSVVVTSDKNILAELPISFGGDPSKGGQFGVANPSGASAGLTSVAFPNLNTTMTNALSATTVVSQTVNLYNPGASTITVRGIYVSGTQMVNKTYTVAPNAITAVNVNADSAGLPAGPIGGIFQIVATGAGSSDSFVAELVSASPDWKSVTADQGTYPTSAATGL